MANNVLDISLAIIGGLFVTMFVAVIVESLIELWFRDPPKHSGLPDGKRCPVCDSEDGLFAKFDFDRHWMCQRHCDEWMTDRR